MPDLLALQTESFDRLIGNERWAARVDAALAADDHSVPVTSGLTDIFEEISPIEDFQGTMSLSFAEPEFADAKMTEEECKDRDATFSAPLYVKAEFMNNTTGEIKQQTVFMGDFPLMTRNGTFIINGTERVVVSQLVRSPGAYFERTPDKTSDKEIFSAKIIPSRGAWFELEVDKRDQVGVRLDRKRKQPVTVLLKAMGWTESRILEEFGHYDSIRATLEKDGTADQDEALLDIYRKLRPGEPAAVDAAQTLLNNLYFTPKRYDLAKVGRYKLNRKLGVDVHLGDPNASVLTEDDIVQMVHFIAALHAGVHGRQARGHLRDHPGGQGGQQRTQLGGGERADEGVAVRPVGVEAFDVGEQHELRGAEGGGQGRGGGVRIDVEDLPGGLAVVVDLGGDRRDHGDPPGLDHVEDRGRVDSGDLSHEAEVHLLAVDDGARAAGAQQPRVLAGEADGVRAVGVHEAHELAAHLAGEDHADHVHGLLGGHAQAAAELGRDAEAVEHGVEIVDARLQRVRIARIIRLVRQAHADVVGHDAAVAVAQPEHQVAPVVTPRRVAVQHQHHLAIARALVEHVLEHTLLEHTLLEHARPDLDPPALERVIGKLHAQRLECRNPAARHSIAGTRRVLPPAVPAPTAGRDAAATSG